MEYHIALSPDLDLNPSDFADAWNKNEEVRTLAPITLTPDTKESYLDAATLAIIISTASGIGVGIITNALYDVLKAALIKKGKPHKHLKITQLKQPDGTQLLVVEKGEE